uniref:Uncharacterized protein n=1 Tax=Amphimedon queenslandica TaxID=400682 RepID=A0A1X7TAF7_AMPQE
MLSEMKLVSAPILQEKSENLFFYSCRLHLASYNLRSFTEKLNSVSSNFWT